MFLNAGCPVVVCRAADNSTIRHWQRGSRLLLGAIADYGSDLGFI
jgi:hypothetical protein